MEIYKKIGDPENPEKTITLQHIGRIAQYRQDYDRTWLCWKEALEIWKRIITSEEQAGYIPYLSSCLSALGEFFADKGENARQNFEQALDLREASLPPDHADIAENLILLGKLCAAMKDYRASQMYYKRAIPIHEKVLGQNHAIVRGFQEELKYVEYQLRIH